MNVTPVLRARRRARAAERLRGSMLATLESIARGQGDAALPRLLHLVRCGRAPLEHLEVLVSLLEQREELRRALRAYVSELLAQHDSVGLLAESGIPAVEGFWSGLVRRASHAFLPPAYADSDLRRIIHRVFVAPDSRWLAALAEHELLPRVAELFSDLSTPERIRDVDKAARILASRISGLGLESELAGRMPDQEGNVKAALLRLPVQVHRVLIHRRASERSLERLGLCLGRCETLARYLRIYHRAHGTSARLALLTQRLKLQISRLRAMLVVHAPPARAGEAGLVLARTVVTAIAAEKSATSVRTYLVDSMRLLALEVVGHGASHGAHYIMETRRDYWRFFLKSCGAGALVAVFGNLKLLLPSSAPPFWQAALYSVNYALCFVLIYVTGSALATKQPAMTASTIAESLDVTGSDEVSLQSLSALVRRVVRSQLVSFAGNLIIVFPASLAFAYALRNTTGRGFVTMDKAEHVLSSLHPWQSGSLLFAAIAGFWLFASGLLTGFIDNHVIYTRLARRLTSQPYLVRRLSTERLERVAAFIDAHLGGIAGNVAFGVMLGSTAVIAQFYGISLDIRHITFSAAHFGISTEALWNTAHPLQLALIGVTVLVIGFINFCVSFGLALTTALRSRGVTYRDLRGVIASLRAGAPQN